MGAAILIFFLLQAALRSWRLAILFFVTLPMALAGGLLAVLLTGGTVALGSVAGLLGVFALAARQAMVLLQHYRDLEFGEGLPFGNDLVQAGTRDRVAPILMSVSAIAVAFAPFAVAAGATGFEVVQPMAVVVLGGLVTTTLLTLFVLPAAYARFGYVAEPETWVDELLAEPVPDIDAARAGG